jgi:hypothetical protein
MIKYTFNEIYCTDVKRLTLAAMNIDSAVVTIVRLDTKLSIPCSEFMSHNLPFVPKHPCLYVT